jgi:single-strand DNA-binding protein
VGRSRRPGRSLPAARCNRLSLSGNLTRDIELRSTPNGAQVATLRPDGQGEWADKANEIDVEVWGGQAANCAQYLSKGSRVLVTGELDYREPDRRWIEA